MASTREGRTKGGQRFFEIRVSRGRGKPPVTERWYPEITWSRKTVERELAKEAARFEEAVKAGEVLSRSEQAAVEAEKAAEEAKLLTLRQYVERVFLPQKAVTAAATTTDSYRRELELHVLPVLGDVKMVDISPAMISALLLDYQAGGAACRSVTHLRAVLGSVFEMAFQDESIRENPMRRVKKIAGRKDEPQADEPEAYTPEELAHILQCLQKEPLLWRAYISLLIETGIRRSEGLALQWKDVDFQNLEITVSHTVIYTPETGCCLSSPKSGKARTVYISKDTADMLRQLRQEQSQAAISKWLFPSASNPGEPMWAATVNAYFQRFGERYQIEHFHPHRLRHSFASVSILSGADVVSVSRVLGHANSSITLRVYAHASEESKKRVSNIFQDAIKQGEKQAK